MSNELFERAKPILNQIQQHGYQAYYVGGSVRDYLMQRPIHDIDITTSATPDEIESIFDHTIPVGKEHGTINVVYNRENYEVTTFRAEEEYIDHRRPSDVHFVRDLYEDVQRRDFTINAIAMDTDYQTFDYFSGEDDINNGIIRTVGQPTERFEEDALRILRGLRFQSQLNFKIEYHTYNAMANQMEDIKYLSIERIIVELKKLISGQNVAKSYHHLIELKAFNYIPYFQNFEMHQLNIDEPIHFDTWIALINSKFDEQQPLSPLKISNKEKSHIKQLTTIIRQLPTINTKKDLIMMVYDFDINDILTVIELSTLLSKNQFETPNPLIINPQTIMESYHQLPINERQQLAVNGSDLMQYLNQRGGPWVKDVLRQIECAVVTKQVINSHDDIMKWMDNHVKI